MGACCGCLDGFFGRLLFRSAAFVFRHWLSVFLFVRLCVFVHMCIYAHARASAQTKMEVRKVEDVAHISLSSHMVMYPPLPPLSCGFVFSFFLLSGLITKVFFVEKQLVGTESVPVHSHTAADHINSRIWL